MMDMLFTAVAVLMSLLAGAAGVIILKDINKSEQRGEPASGLIRQLRFISFPGTDEDRHPYLGAAFIGLFLTALGFLGLVGLVVRLVTD